MKRENPYNRLKRISAQWVADNVLYRHRREMWTLDLQNKTYDFTDLIHKIQTANDLGYVIELSSEKDKVIFTYIKKLPTHLPYELRY